MKKIKKTTKRKYVRKTGAAELKYADRILVKDQIDPSKNGIYVCDSEILNPSAPPIDPKKPSAFHITITITIPS